MNRDEARFLLSGVRADRIDRSDPRIDEALRLVERDPELRNWFEASGRIDRAVSERLAELSPPPGLRDSILVGMRISRPSRWRRRSAILFAAAAALAPGLFFAWFLKPGSVSPFDEGGAGFAEFEADMLDMITNLDSLDHRSSDPEDILAWLREQGIESVPALASGDVPEKGEGRAFAGCKIVDWRGYRVSLICLRRESGKGMPDLHLVTVPAEAIDDLARDEIVAHLPDAETSARRWSTAMWQSGDLVHLVVVEGKHSDPRRLLPLG